MGSASGSYDEKPEHKVFTDGFYIDLCEVTNAQYKAFLDDTGRPAPGYWSGHNYPPGSGNHPVVGVRHADAVAYAQWVGKRLPT